MCYLIPVSVSPSASCTLRLFFISHQYIHYIGLLFSTLEGRSVPAIGFLSPGGRFEHMRENYNAPGERTSSGIVYL